CSSGCLLTAVKDHARTPASALNRRSKRRAAGQPQGRDGVLTCVTPIKYRQGSQPCRACHATKTKQDHAPGTVRAGRREHPGAWPRIDRESRLDRAAISFLRLPLLRSFLLRRAGARSIERGLACPRSPALSSG